MTKLNKIFLLVGILLLTGGCLLLVFPDIMKYIFSVASILAGIAFLVIVWTGRNTRK